ncbi:hypothetical protein KL935_004613 [Ogataea polymorpha]|nr:hypothetical protein KL908_004092 [Ogataea polymorpha]KAG7898060.1 hypothetical protein KL935_004613 [Ogataea polymorpha]KAG7906226.1 hypothetical protein KL906_004679 [Ogataea polymorpha]KAG7914161.1 hypothetical protein KL927_004812 [Ogataea polymorpha]
MAETDSTKLRDCNVRYERRACRVAGPCSRATVFAEGTFSRARDRRGPAQLLVQPVQARDAGRARQAVARPVVQNGPTPVHRHRKRGVHARQLQPDHGSRGARSRVRQRQNGVVLDRQQRFEDRANGQSCALDGPVAGGTGLARGPVRTWRVLRTTFAAKTAGRAVSVAAPLRSDAVSQLCQLCLQNRRGRVAQKGRRRGRLAAARSVLPGF